MKRYLSHSTEETEQIAAEFASTLKSGDDLFGFFGAVAEITFLPLPVDCAKDWGFPTMCPAQLLLWYTNMETAVVPCITSICTA